MFEPPKKFNIRVSSKNAEFWSKKFLKKSLRKKMNKNLGIRFNEIAEMNGDKIALRFSLKEKYTFNDLNILSEKFLNFFQLINLKSNDCILIESSKAFIRMF